MNGPLTAPFTLSAHSQGYYSHFTPLTTLYRAYYKATHVIPSRRLRLSTLLGPLVPNHHPTLTMALITDLSQHGRS
jgi:hypothetical protein